LRCTSKGTEMQRNVHAPLRHPHPRKVTPSVAAWYLLMPLALLVWLVEWLDIDRSLAHAMFFRSATAHWLGSGPGAWWARGVIHQGGRDLVRAIAAAALATWGLSYAYPKLAPWRREALFVFLGIVLVTGVVGLLKVMTNVDCPWDLAGFGGGRPYVTLFGNRPAYLPRAQCFPGAHSSSGFALLSLSFALRARRALLARWLLAAALLVGVVFSIGQEARGAHFFSHDLASALLAWWLLLALRQRMLDMPAAPAVAGAAAVDSGLWRRSFLTARLSPAEEPDDGADRDHRDADAVADTCTPVVDPAHQQEVDIHKTQHKRTGAEQHQQTTNTLHDSPLAD
jgi:membrane-associated PAP2 superfamily phosphatase